MISTELDLERFTLNLQQEIHVKASLELTFEALLEQLGPANEGGEGRPMPMKLEAWPGGRWYRDLGDNNGHFWAHVQAIKKPALLELCGPLFASYPLVSNVQCRLSEVNDGTLLAFRHTALGFMQDDHRGGVVQGWRSILERVQRRAESQ